MSASAARSGATRVRRTTGRTLGLVGLFLLCVTACGPCGDKPSSSGERTAEPVRSKRELLEQRLAEQRPDPSNTYEKLGDGSTDCGEDVKCFAVHAERCEPAVLERDQRTKALLMTHRVHARYRIAGLAGLKCRVQRAVIAAEAELLKGTLEGLDPSTQTPDQVEKLRLDSQAELVARHPPRLTCELSRDAALELALDIAEKEPLGGHFADDCHVPLPDEEWPASLVVRAADAPDAPDAPAEPRVPAAPANPAAPPATKP